MEGGREVWWMGKMKPRVSYEMLNVLRRYVSVIEQEMGRTD